MKSVIALFITLFATASAFAPVQQTVGAYLIQSRSKMVVVPLSGVGRGISNRR